MQYEFNVMSRTSRREHTDNKDKLDLYLPEGRPNAPVIVSYYGNQLMGGDKSEDAFIGRRFASAGFVTAVVNYRLSPAVSHPAHIQDAAASFAWAKRHIAEYGGDPDRVFVIGYSAGGYLAALLATDPRYLAAHKLSPHDIRASFPSARSTGSSGAVWHRIATRACGALIGRSG